MAFSLAMLASLSRRKNFAVRNRATPAFTMTAPLRRDGDTDEMRATWSSTQQMTGREAVSTSPLTVPAALLL
jgi:hypothetical protein